MFEWSKYQTDELRGCLGDEKAQYWIIPIIHGSFQQRRLSLFGQYIDLALLARRSRHYAGTRYLKRGTSVHGKVANDCETEMILQTHHGQSLQLASCLTMRGSVPTYWQQETSVTMPVPPIVVHKVDPSYRATQDHFSDLLRRYSYPIIVLDLLKLSERTPRETMLGTEFKNSISLLNSTLVGSDRGKKLIRYCALDFSQISKCGIKQQQQQQQHSQHSVSEVDQEQLAHPMIPTNKINSVTGIKDKKLLLADNSRIINQISNANNSSSVDLTGASSSSSASSATRIPFYATTSSSSSSSKKPLVSTSKAATGGQKASVVRYDREDAARVDNPAVATASSSSSGPSSAFDKHHRSKCSTSPAMASLTTSDGNTAAKGNVLADLEEIADWALSETLFFCSSTKYLDSLGIAPLEVVAKCSARGHMEQRGVVRTNCLDCLDRTNVAQFSVGLKFLQLGLRALGLSGAHVTAPSNTMILNLMDMFSELGDRLALQYGGSEAHKKVSVGQGGSAGKSKHGDLLTSIKRYYSNAFTDRVKQDAMNLFLGYYVPTLNEIPLWELETDYSLHNNYLFRKALYVETLLFNLGANSNRNRRFYSYNSFASVINARHSKGSNNAINDNNSNTTEIKKRHIILPDTLDDDDDENSCQSEDLSSFSSLYEIAKSKYLIPDTRIDALIAKVKVAEKRKRKVRRDTEEVLYALGNWWTEATIDYQMNRISPTARTTTAATATAAASLASSSCTPLTRPLTTAELPSPYDGELSNGISLLSFDQLLSYEFLQPVEVSEMPTTSTSSSHSSYGKISLLKGYWTAGKSDADSQQEDEEDQEGGDKDADINAAPSPSTAATTTMTTAVATSRDSKLCNDSIRDNISINNVNKNSSIDSLIAAAGSRSTDIFDDKNSIIEDSDLSKKFSSSQTSGSVLTLSSMQDSDSRINVSADVEDSRSSTKPSYSMIQPPYKSEPATGPSVLSGGINSLPVTGPKHQDSSAWSEVSSQSQDHSIDQPPPNSHIVFNLGNYVRKISLKAKSFVDFIRRDHDHSNHNLPIQYNSYQTKKWGSGTWSLHDIIHEDSNIPMSSADAYIQYVQHAESPESLYEIDKNHSGRQHEMQYQLADSLIDCDDVTAMQQLAEDSHVNAVIQEGLYKGIEQSQSAIWAAGLVNYAMILTEPLLETNIRSFCNEHTSPTTPLIGDRNNILTKDIRTFVDELKHGHSLSNSGTTKSKDISIPETTESLLERCMQGGGKDDFRTVSGLVQDGLYLAQEYQQQYLQYAEDISVDVLQRRINTTANNESTLLHYCSLFSLESVGDDFENVQYLVSDLDKDDVSHMHDFQSYVSSLQPYITTSNAEKQKKLISQEKVCSNDFKEKANYKFDNKKRLSSGNKLTGGKVAYTGFMEIQEDLYAKADNASFLLNEAAVNTFSNSHYLL